MINFNSAVAPDSPKWVSSANGQGGATARSTAALWLQRAVQPPEGKGFVDTSTCPMIASIWTSFRVPQACSAPLTQHALPVGSRKPVEIAHVDSLTLVHALGLLGVVEVGWFFLSTRLSLAVSRKLPNDASIPIWN